MFRKNLVILAAATGLVAAALIPAAQAAGPPPGKGGGHTTTGTNSLSVPAIFVPSASPTFSFVCDSGGIVRTPSGVPSTGFEIDPAAYFYVQGVNPWQAQCATAGVGTVSVGVEWGDNLNGDAALKAGSPIRVEVALVDASGAQMNGYVVKKLEPSKLDRESKYGTLAIGDPTSGFTADPTAFPYTYTNDEGVQTTVGVRVWDSLAHLSIVRIDPVDPPLTVYDGAFVAEINATGSVVYGYNWGSGKGRASATQAGTYLITFEAPSVTVLSADLGTVVDTHTVTLTVTVRPKR